MATQFSCPVKPEASVIAIIGSIGDTKAMRKVLSDLPADFPAPVICLQHLNPERSSVLVDTLQKQIPLAVRWAYSGVRLEQGVYVCPAVSYPVVHPDRTLSILPALSRPAWPAAADCLLVSTASAFAQRAIVVVLSGLEEIGSSSLHTINDRHGIVIVQDPAPAGTAASAVTPDCADFVVTLDEIAPILIKLVMERCVPAPSGNQQSNCELLAKLKP